MSAKQLTPQAGIVQHAYVTNGFDRAIEQFTSHYGIERFLTMRQYPLMIGEGRQAVASIGLAYLGNLMIEIIQPEGGDCAIYQDVLPSSGFAVRFHHHGFMVRSYADNPHETYNALKQHYVKRGIAIVVEGFNQRSGTKYFYADTREELGHYMEHVSMTEQTVEDYSKVPVTQPAAK